MKKYPLIVFVLLACILFSAKTDLAQTPVDLGSLNDKAKILAKPSDPFDVIYGSMSGEVKVNITVDEKGNVSKANAVSGDDQLRFAAVAAAQESKFLPYVVKGKAVKVKGFLTFQFGASNEAALKDSINKAVANENLKEKAQTLYNKGEYEEAIKILTALIDGSFLNISERELRAHCYFELKDYNNVLKDINDSIIFNKKENLPKVFNFQGDIYVKLINYAKAVESYAKVIELDPNNAIAFGSRGYAYAKLFKKAESTADFKRVIEIDPKDKYAAYNLDALANDRKVLSREEYKKLKQIYYV